MNNNYEAALKDAKHQVKSGCSVERAIKFVVKNYDLSFYERNELSEELHINSSANAHPWRR